MAKKVRASLSVKKYFDVFKQLSSGFLPGVVMMIMIMIMNKIHLIR